MACRVGHVELFVRGRQAFMSKVIAGGDQWESLQ